MLLLDQSPAASSTLTHQGKHASSAATSFSSTLNPQFPHKFFVQCPPTSAWSILPPAKVLHETMLVFFSFLTPQSPTAQQFGRAGSSPRCLHTFALGRAEIPPQPPTLRALVSALYQGRPASVHSESTGTASGISPTRAVLGQKRELFLESSFSSSSRTRVQ